MVGVTGLGVLAPPNAEQLDTSQKHAYLGSQQWDSKLQSPLRKMETALKSHMEERGAEIFQKKKTLSAAFEDGSGKPYTQRGTALQMSCKNSHLEIP